MINCSHLSVSPTKSTEWPVEGLRGRAGEQLQHRSGSNMSGTISRAQWQAQEREQIITISQAVIHRKSFYPDTKPKWTKKWERDAMHTVPCHATYKAVCTCPGFHNFPTVSAEKKNINLFPQRLIISFELWFLPSPPLQRHAPVIYHLYFFHLSLSIATFVSPPWF